MQAEARAPFHSDLSILATSELFLSTAEARFDDFKREDCSIFVETLHSAPSPKTPSSSNGAVSGGNSQISAVQPESKG